MTRYCMGASSLLIQWGTPAAIVTTSPLPTARVSPPLIPDPRTSPGAVVLGSDRVPPVIRVPPPSSTYQTSISFSWSSASPEAPLRMPSTRYSAAVARGTAAIRPAGASRIALATSAADTSFTAGSAALAVPATAMERIKGSIGLISHSDSRGSCLVAALSRPQPSERTRGEAGVDQPVHRDLEGGQPRAVVPDGRLPERDRVSDERGGSDETEHGQVFRAHGQRASRDVGGEEADHDAVEEPLDEVLTHPPRAVRKHGHHHDRALLQLFRELRRLHVLLARGAGDHVVARRDGERAKGVHHLVFVRHLG